MCVSCQVCSSEGSICGRNEESGKRWQERGAGLKGEGEKRRGSLIQEILDPHPHPHPHPTPLCHLPPC